MLEQLSHELGETLLLPFQMQTLPISTSISRVCRFVLVGLRHYKCCLRHYLVPKLVLLARELFSTQGGATTAYGPAAATCPIRFLRSPLQPLPLAPVRSG